jgi:hypothetical protein
VDLEGLETPPVSSVSGSFRFLYDDSVVPSGSQLSITPTEAFAQVGSVTFDESNTEVRLFIIRGNLFQIFWGGLAGGQANIIRIGTDDIAVGYLASGPFSLTYTQTGSAGRFRSSLTGGLDFRVVPDPSIALLDIKPGSDLNPVNPMSRGVIPVAILGSDTLET